MTKTSCLKCIFSDTVESLQPCKFDIPAKIKNIKMLNIVDNYYEIENYKCLYGFSKNQFSLNSQYMENIDLLNLAKTRADIKYYLIVDTRQSSIDAIDTLIKNIESYEVLPKYLSIIVDPVHADAVYQIVRSKQLKYKWTIHAFVEELSFNDSINTILDTNLLSSESWCLLFVNLSKSNNTISLSKIILQMQNTFIIEQKGFHGMNMVDDDLNFLCLNCYVYKSIISTISRDILYGIKSTPEINLIKYEI